MCGLPTRPKRRLALALLLLAAATAGWAAEAPIQIEADRAEVSQRTGESVYTGDVVLTRGALTLRGQRLTVTRGDSGRIHAVLTGEPARIERDRDGEDPVRGHARKLTYDAGGEMLELTGEAYIERGGNDVRGESIRHDLASGRTEADRGEDERVRITIQPESADDAARDGGDGG